MAKILVLGGTGFLGKHVARLTREAGHDVTTVSRHEGLDLTDLPATTERFRQLQPQTIMNCAAHVGSVHYAMRHSASMFHDNVQMLLNIYRAVAKACPQARIVNPISNCSYPGDAEVQREHEWLAGPVHESVLAYGTHRRMIYDLAECYRREHGVRTINWIVANAYGPGDYTDPDKVHALNGIIIRLIKAQRAGEGKFEIWGSGRPIREWVYVEDVARLMTASVTLDDQTAPLNFAQNRGYSITDIARTAADLLDYSVDFVFNTKMADGAPIKVLDDTRFRAAFADFKFTPLERGIRETIKYYQGVL